MDVEIGVLALQGDVSEHIGAFRRALTNNGVQKGAVVAVRTPSDLARCDGLAIPGGESTTISRLINQNGLYRPIKDFEGGVFATCAGMVLVASEINDPRVQPLGMMDLLVDRNAFGRQRESFEAPIPIKNFDRPFHAIFIRSPLARRAGRGTEVLGRMEQGIVAVREKQHLALSFHPELGNDLRFHQLFLEMQGFPNPHIPR